jgi:hypothetical protein
MECSKENYDMYGITVIYDIPCTVHECLYRQIAYCTQEFHNITPNSSECKNLTKAKGK